MVSKISKCMQSMRIKVLCTHGSPPHKLRTPCQSQVPSGGICHFHCDRNIYMTLFSYKQVLHASTRGSTISHFRQGHNRLFKKHLIVPCIFVFETQTYLFKYDMFGKRESRHIIEVSNIQ